MYRTIGHCTPPQSPSWTGISLASATWNSQTEKQSTRDRGSRWLSQQWLRSRVYFVDSEAFQAQVWTPSLGRRILTLVQAKSWVCPIESDLRVIQRWVLPHDHYPRYIRFNSGFADIYKRDPLALCSTPPAAWRPCNFGATWVVLIFRQRLTGARARLSTACNDDNCQSVIINTTN